MGMEDIMGRARLHSLLRSLVMGMIEMKEVRREVGRLVRSPP